MEPQAHHAIPLLPRQIFPELFIQIMMDVYSSATLDYYREGYDSCFPVSYIMGVELGDRFKGGKIILAIISSER